MHVYIFIYISLLANKRLTTLLLHRWAGIRCTLLNSFFFFLDSFLGEAEAFGIKNNKRTHTQKKNTGLYNESLREKLAYLIHKRGQKKMSTTRCYHTSMAANNVPFFFFLRMKTANTVVRGVGKLTIQGCDYLQNSVKTAQKKKRRG